MTEPKSPPKSLEEQLRDAATQFQNPQDAADLPPPPAAGGGSLADTFGQAAAALGKPEEPPAGEGATDAQGAPMPKEFEDKLRRAAQYQAAQRPDGDLREAVLLARPEESVAEPPDDEDDKNNIPQTD